MNIANYHRIDSFSGARPLDPPASGLDAFGQDLKALIGILWRRKLSIIATAALFVAAGLLFVLLSTPLYRSSTQILIDPRSKRVLQAEEVVPSGLGTSSQGADSLLVDSQIEIIGSDSVLRRVVETQGLARDPEFSKPMSPGLRAKLLALLGDPSGTADNNQDPTELALQRLREALYVKRVGNTYVIQIYMLLPSGRQAAAIANAVAEAYLADEVQASSSSTRDATDTLTARFDELRANVERAENRVEDYRKAHDLIGTQGVLIDEQQLQDINQRLGAARARVETAQARFDQAQLLARSGSAAASAADGLDSPALIGLRTNLADIDRKRAELSAVFGPSHPQMKTIEAQHAIAQRQLAEELSLVLQRARSELELARADETSLTASLSRMKQVALTNNEAQIKLRELQRDADASKAVLENVLTRAKQSSEQEDLATSNFRIITKASAPIRAAYPPALLVLAGALLAGLAVGALLAWLRDHFTAKDPSFERSAA